MAVVEAVELVVLLVVLLQLALAQLALRPGLSSSLACEPVQDSQSAPQHPAHLPSLQARQVSPEQLGCGAESL